MSTLLGVRMSRIVLWLGGNEIPSYRDCRISELRDSVGNSVDVHGTVASQHGKKPLRNSVYS